MAAGADSPSGYTAPATPNALLDGMDTGRSVSAVPVIVQKVTHGVTGVQDGNRQVATAGTAVRLTAASTLCRKVIVQALSTNGDVVVVGGSTVVAAPGTQATPTRRGFALGPGDFQEFEIADLTNVWLDAIRSGDGVSFVYWTHG